MWKSKVQKVYSSLDELKAYDELYAIVTSCGYDDAEKLWNDNPYLQGSTNPSDFGLWKPKPKKAKKVKAYDTVGNIMAFEGGELEAWDTVELFVQLGNAGQVYHLQSSYGRGMDSLLEQGYIVKNSNGKYENAYPKDN